MPKSYLIHGAWVLVAAGAFALGKMQSSDRPGAGNNLPANAKGGVRGGANYSAGAEAATDRGAKARREAGEGAIIGSGNAFTPSEMEVAMSTVLAETDPIVRQRRFTELLESLTAENAEAAVRALREAPRSRWNWGQEFSLLTFAWGRVDGPAAVAYAKEQEGRTKEWTMASVLAGWASDRPEEAKSWVAGIEDKDEQRSFTRGLVYGLSQRDVNAATDFVFSLPQTDGNRSAEYMSSIARQQLSQGLESAADWSSSLPDGKLKGSALEAVAGEYVRRNPQEAAQWAAQFANADYAGGAIAEISEEWAEDNPQDALEWVITLPEGANRTRALGETISEWTRENPGDAGDYLASMPQGGERDTAISSFSRRLAYEEPATAIEWAQSIASDDLRNSTVTRAAREWMQRDVTAASTWLQTANLPEPVVQEILKPREGGDRREWWRR